MRKLNANRWGYEAHRKSSTFQLLHPDIYRRKCQRITKVDDNEHVQSYNMRYNVCTAFLMTIAVVWDMTQWWLVICYRRFGKASIFRIVEIFDFPTNNLVTKLMCGVQDLRNAIAGLVKVIVPWTLTSAVNGCERSSTLTRSFTPPPPMRNSSTYPLGGSLGKTTYF